MIDLLFKFKNTWKWIFLLDTIDSDKTIEIKD